MQSELLDCAFDLSNRVERKSITIDLFFAAEEIRQQANADGNRIKTVSEADYEKKVQYSYAHAWKGLYSNLSVTQEAHKLSLMMIKALDDIHENLYFGYGYEKNTIFVN